MTREEFSTLSKGHILYLDGATGSNLVKAGMPSGVCPEQWIGSLTVGYQKKVPAGRIKPAFFVSNFWFLSIVFYCNVL